MKNRIRIFGAYLPFFILLTVAAISLKTVATVGFFNYRHHYFTNQTLPLIANILIAVCAVFFIIYILSARAEVKLIPNFSSPANYAPSSAVAAALVFMMIHLIKAFLHSQTPIIKWISLILSFFALLSIVYFALNAIFTRTVSVRRANFGLFTVIFLALYLAYLYFDTEAPINSPIKIADELAYAFAAVFFLYEIRLSLGREKWKAYIIFGFIAALLTAYSSIPALITYFVSEVEISNSVYESILSLSIFIFITAKLFLTDRLTEQKESPFIEKLKKAAEKREHDLTASAEPYQAPTNEEVLDNCDKNQISILDASSFKEENFPEAENTEISTNIISEENE